jgi:hypothetical protein
MGKFFVIETKYPVGSAVGGCGEISCVRGATLVKADM